MHGAADALKGIGETSCIAGSPDLVLEQTPGEIDETGGGLCDIPSPLRELKLARQSGRALAVAQQWAAADPRPVSEASTGGRPLGLREACARIQSILGESGSHRHDARGQFQ